MSHTSELPEEEESSVLYKNDGFDDDDDEKRSIGSTILSYLKFSSIVFAYAVAFVTMVHFGIWLADISTTSQIEFQEKYKENQVLDWIYDMKNGDLWNATTEKLLIDLGLLLLFVFQHSILSSKIIGDSSLWRWLRYNYKIDKTIYTILTGITLQVVIRNWQYIPVRVWDLEFLRDNKIYIAFHAMAWACFYGTTLMLDLPEMVGFNQVIIQSPTITVKSPQLQMMCQKQRHMGLVPFLVMFLSYPYMSLDRFILTIFLSSYLCLQWSSDSCYEYVKDMKHLKKQRLSDSFGRIAN